METGELAESVRNRSVLRQLHITETVGLHGPDGRNESSWSESFPFIAAAGPLPGYADMPWCQVTAAANSLAAMGAASMMLSVQGLLPATMEEPQLREDMKRFAAAAAAEGTAFDHADIQVSPEVTAPKYFVTGVGWGVPGGGQPGLCPGQELVMTRQIALAGTAALARANEEVLRRRFPFRLVDRAKGFGRWMSVTEAARAVNHFGSYPMTALSQGGIFNALWETAEKTGVGLEVDLKRIPVCQETIEICEYLDVNPYYLYSAGSLLIGTDRAGDLIALLRDCEIPACVIGRVTGRRERVILNGENRRFLDRPKQDEWWRLATAKQETIKQEAIKWGS